MKVVKGLFFWCFSLMSFLSYSTTTFENGVLTLDIPSGQTTAISSLSDVLDYLSAGRVTNVVKTGAGKLQLDTPLMKYTGSWTLAQGKLNLTCVTNALGIKGDGSGRVVVTSDNAQLSFGTSSSSPAITVNKAVYFTRSSTETSDGKALLSFFNRKDDNLFQEYVQADGDFGFFGAGGFIVEGGFSVPNGTVSNQGANNKVTIRNKPCHIKCIKPTYHQWIFEVPSNHVEKIDLANAGGVISISCENAFLKEDAPAVIANQMEQSTRFNLNEHYVTLSKLKVTTSRFSVNGNVKDGKVPTLCIHSGTLSLVHANNVNSAIRLDLTGQTDQAISIPTDTIISMSGFLYNDVYYKSGFFSSTASYDYVTTLPCFNSSSLGFLRIAKPFSITVPQGVVTNLSDILSSDDLAAITNNDYSTIRKLGPGTLQFDANLSGYEGEIELKDGVSRVTSTNNPFGVSNPLGLDHIYIYPADGARLQFYTSCTFDKHFTFPQGCSSSSAGFYFHDNTLTTFLKPITLESGSVNFIFRSSISCYGGLNLNGSCWQNCACSPQWRVYDKPVVCTGIFYLYYNHLHLSAPGNVFNTLRLASGANVTLEVANALTNTTMNLAFENNNTAGGNLNLNGFDATIGSIVSTAKSFTINTPSRLPATLTVYQSTVLTNGTSDFTGALSVVKRGAAEWYLNRTITAKGNFTVEDGRVILGTAGSWSNAYCVTVSNTGTLEITHDGALFNQVDLVVADSGRIQLDGNVFLTCSSLMVNGFYLEGGEYGAVGSGAEKELACLSGTGRLHVPKPFSVRVSPDGDMGAEQTFLDARNRIRAVRNAGLLPSGVPIEVVVAPGDYVFTNTLALEAADVGTQDAPVTWRAQMPGTVRILGGVLLHQDDFSAVTDEVAQQKFQASVLSSLRVADISPYFPNGIRALSDTFRTPCVPLLMSDGEYLEMARWPNVEDGWVTFTQKTSRPAPGGFITCEDRAANWDFSEGVWLYGYWRKDWAETFVRASEWIPGTREMVLTGTPTYVEYDVDSKRRYYAFNIACELDSPGEWWIDRSAKKLYFYPPSDCWNRELALSVLNVPLISLASKVHDIRFENLDFAYGSTATSTGSYSYRITYTNCTFSSFSSGVASFPGTDGTFVDCTVSHIGATAVSMGGGSQKSLTPSRNKVTNCRFYDFGHFQRTGAPAVSIYGCGQVVTHSVFSNAPHTAINFYGNEHFIGWNDFRDVLRETSDAGCIYGGRDSSELGSVFAGNRFREFGKNLANADVVGIYFDDCEWGGSVIANRFEGIRRGVLLGGGELHLFAGNYFTNCMYGIHVDRRGMLWDYWQKTYTNFWWDCVSKFSPHELPWKAAYPWLLTALADNPGEPLYNVFLDNVFVDHTSGGYNIAYECGSSNAAAYTPLPAEQVFLTNNWTVSTFGTLTPKAVRGFTHLAGSSTSPVSAPIPETFARLRDIETNEVTHTILSPDGKLVLSFALDTTRRLSAAVVEDDLQVLSPSHVGLTVDRIDVGKMHQLGEPTYRTESDSKAVASARATGFNECVFPLISVVNGRTNAFVEARVFNGGCAWRLHAPGTGERLVSGCVNNWNFGSVQRIDLSQEDVPENWNEETQTGEIVTPWYVLQAGTANRVNGILFVDVASGASRGLNTAEIACLRENAVSGVVKTGPGTLVLDLDLSGYYGPWIISNGVAKVAIAKYAFGSDSDAKITSVETSGNKAYRLTFDVSCWVNRPIHIYAANTQSVVLNQDAKVFFMKPVYLSAISALRFYAGSNAEAHFKSNFTVDRVNGWACISGPGLVSFEGTPVSGRPYFWIEGGVKVNFACPSNAIGTLSIHGSPYYGNTRVTFGADDCLAGNLGVPIALETTNRPIFNLSGHTVAGGKFSFRSGQILVPDDSCFKCTSFWRKGKRQQVGIWRAPGNSGLTFDALEGTGSLVVQERYYPPRSVIIFK